MVYESGKYFKSLLETSGATLSIVTSKFPKSTGSLAIFSGLLGKTDKEAVITKKISKTIYGDVLRREERGESVLSEVGEQLEHVLV